jgi:hypothetical protein
MQLVRMQADARQRVISPISGLHGRGYKRTVPWTNYPLVHLPCYRIATGAAICSKYHDSDADETTFRNFLATNYRIVDARKRHSMEMRRQMFLGLGLLLLLLWLGGFFVFHISAFFIHILLILAVVSIIFHFMRGTASLV